MSNLTLVNLVKEMTKTTKEDVVIELFIDGALKILQDKGISEYDLLTATLACHLISLTKTDKIIASQRIGNFYNEYVMPAVKGGYNSTIFGQSANALTSNRLSSTSTVKFL